MSWFSIVDAGSATTKLSLAVGRSHTLGTNSCESGCILIKSVFELRFGDVLGRDDRHRGECLSYVFIWWSRIDVVPIPRITNMP